MTLEAFKNYCQTVNSSAYIFDTTNLGRELEGCIDVSQIYDSIVVLCDSHTICFIKNCDYICFKDVKEIDVEELSMVHRIFKITCIPNGVPLVYSVLASW